MELKITIDGLDISTAAPPEIVKAIEKDLTAFNSWMQEKLGGQMIELEKRILLTYLYKKIKGEF